MPSGPSLFDDEDEVARNDDAHFIASDPSTPRPEPAHTPLHTRDPNYLIRRAIVVACVVAVVAVAAIVIGRVIGSRSDNNVGSGTIDAEWDRVVLVDDRTGRVIVADGAGEEIARIETGVRSPTAGVVIGPTVLATGADAIAVVDLDTETSAPSDLTDATIVRPSGSALTMVATQPANDRAVLVHGPTGDTIDTDTSAPMVGAQYQFADARTGPSGRDVLVTDSGNFQSVLFSFDRDAPSFFSGFALAVGDDIVVTTQNIGTDATVSVFDHDGTMITTGRTPSVRAAMITDTTVLLATADGELVEMDPKSGDTQTLTALEVGAVRAGDVTPDGDRFVVTGTDGTVIIDADGAIVETFDGQYPAGDDPVPRGARCLTLHDDASTSEQRISVIDTTDGSVVVEAVGNAPVAASVDGCTVVTPTSDGYDLLAAPGPIQFESGDTVVALAPDANSVVVERGSRLLLVAVAPSDGSEATADAEPIDLGPRGRSVGFFRS